MSDAIFEHVLYLVASSRDCLDEPLVYGPLRMIEGASRLIEAFPDDEFLARQRQVMEREKYQVMNDREAFAAWLDDVLRQFAAESKRRNLGASEGPR